MAAPSSRALARSGRPGTALALRPSTLLARRPAPRVARRPARRAAPLPGRRSVRLGGTVYDRDQLTAVVSLALVAMMLLDGPDAAVDEDATSSATETVAAAPASADAAPSAAPAGTGCTADDPTTDGCVTPATAHTMNEVERVFGSYRDGPTLRSAFCKTEHRPWAPNSDHPKGKGCDLFPGKSGEFPAGRDLDNGWAVANWLRTHQEALAVRYLIWQGRIWSDQRGNWDSSDGAPYSGGGVYDPGDATGGHYDHLHISFER